MAASPHTRKMVDSWRRRLLVFFSCAILALLVIVLETQEWDAADINSGRVEYKPVSLREVSNPQGELPGLPADAPPPLIGPETPAPTAKASTSAPLTKLRVPRDQRAISRSDADDLKRRRGSPRLPSSREVSTDALNGGGGRNRAAAVSSTARTVTNTRATPSVASSTPPPSITSTPAPTPWGHDDGAIKVGEVAKGVWVYPDVCVVDDPEPRSHWYRDFRDGSEREVVIGRKLVVYGQEEEGRLQVGEEIPWVLERRTGRAPEAFEYREHAAMFLGCTCEGNLAHWLDQTLTVAYHGFKVAGWWESWPYNKKVQVLLNKDSEALHPFEPGCHGMTYKDMLYAALPTRKELAPYWKVPHGTCFSHALFSITADGLDYSDFSDTVRRGLGVKDGKCPRDYVLIIDRHHRSLYNAKEVLDTVLQLGFEHAKIVFFEDLSVAEQMQEARCAQIVITVHGAAIAYMMFMRPGSIVWQVSGDVFPEDRRYFVFDGMAQNSNVEYLTHVEYGDHIHPPKGPIYHQAKKRVIPEKEAADAFQEGDIWVHKHADVEVSIHALERFLEQTEAFKRVLARRGAYTS